MATKKKPVKRTAKKPSNKPGKLSPVTSKIALVWRASRADVVWAKIRSLRWFARWPIYIVLFIAIFQACSWFVDEALMRPAKDPQYGVSFSIPYAQELGNNWQDNYLALLNDIGFKHLRLMSYWEDIEPQPGQYNFTNLDWELQQANLHHAKVSLAIGFRQPRYPECHQPAWAAQLPVNSPQWDSALYSYMHTVINHYKNNPAIESYQLENEAENAWFGSCPGGAAPKTRLTQEFNLVKSWDPNHPVWMSLGDEHGFPTGKPVPDAYGFSIYRIVYSTNTPIHFYVTYPITDWYHRLRAFIIEKTQHRPIYIHELQLEPWGPKATEDLTAAQQNQSMSVHQIHASIRFANKTGIQDEYFWGGEWWYWRMTKFNDSGPWNAVKQEVQKSPQKIGAFQLKT